MKNKDIDTLFLGTGWSFPPTFVKSNGEVELVSAVIDINQSLEILLGTTLGERIMHPGFGCNLKQYLFQPMSSFDALAKDMIEKAILRHEPRIILDDISLDLEAEVEGMLLIEIDYTIRSTNSRSNYVYPFYLIEGTNT